MLSTQSLRLAVFTRSRPGEYAQTVGTQSKAFRVPDAPAELAGQPIAFIACDNHRPTLREMLKILSLAVEGHIRFQNEKSARNFTIRMYRRGRGLLNPIDAGVFSYTMLSNEYTIKTMPVVGRRRNPCQPLSISLDNFTVVGAWCAYSITRLWVGWPRLRQSPKTSARPGRRGE